jgi:hypothetical protein
MDPLDITATITGLSVNNNHTPVAERSTEPQSSAVKTSTAGTPVRSSNSRVSWEQQRSMDAEPRNKPTLSRSSLKRINQELEDHAKDPAGGISFGPSFDDLVS